MKKSAFLSDVLFSFFLVGLFSLCLFRYLRLPLALALFLALLCGFLVACSYTAFLKSKRNTFLLKRSDEALKEKLFLHLSLISDAEKSQLFSSALAKAQNAEIQRRGKLRLQTESEEYFLCFRFAPVSADDVAVVSRIKTRKRKTLLCERIEESAQALCNKLCVDVKTGDWVFLFLKSHDALPARFLGEDLPQTKRSRAFRLCFSKSNAKRFLASGACLLSASLLSPFPYYYLIFGSLLLLVALFIRIFGYSR